MVTVSAWTLLFFFFFLLYQKVAGLNSSGWYLASKYDLFIYLCLIKLFLSPRLEKKNRLWRESIPLDVTSLIWLSLSFLNRWQLCTVGAWSTNLGNDPMECLQRMLNMLTKLKESKQICSENFNSLTFYSDELYYSDQSEKCLPILKSHNGYKAWAINLWLKLLHSGVFPNLNGTLL